jgi:PmbA protein
MAIDAQVVQDLLQTASTRGATGGDALLVDSTSFEAQVRLGDVETVQNSHQKRLGLRLFFGQRSATTSTSDFSPASLGQLLDDTCALAQAMADDEHAGLPSPDEVATAVPDLALCDDSLQQLPPAERIAMARDAEQAALDYDSRITNSEGGSYNSSQGEVTYVNSHGFVGHYRASQASLSVSSVASDDAGGMQSGSWFTAGRRRDALQAPEALGQEAARRTLQRLGARRVPTQKVPVVFDASVAAGLLNHLFSAVSGAAIYRGASFLTNCIGQQIAPETVTVYDDGTLPGAPGSKPFDGEGVPTRRTIVVEQGILRTYLLDTYTGRKLGMRSTGNAARSAGEPPSVSPTNFYMVPGTATPDEIIASVPNGLYVTGLIGFGVNPVTGDYSRGASGLWIERGELIYAVEEITIAGNLRQMLADIEMIGNDLDRRRRVMAPTLKIRKMTIAGS